MASTTQRGHTQVGRLSMYHEQQGTGRPLLLLHAGFSTIDTSFDQLRPRLADRWTTIAIEQQAHGRTADIDRPLAYEQMVEDTAALVKRLELGEPADVFGWSDGGIVGLGLAARHPSLVRRVAIIGAGYNADAETPEFRERLAKLQPDNEHLAPFREHYEQIAPDPTGWPTLIEKVTAMYFGFKGWSRQEMKSLQAPLMVMLGDQDAIRLEHAIELFRLVPDGRLAVLPGSDHSAPVAHTDWVVGMLTDFFDAPDKTPG